MSAPLEMDARQMLKKLTEPSPELAGQTVVDEKEVFESLLLKMFGGFLNSSILPSASIYRVPKELFQLKESAYTPHLFPIGPLHINEEHLKSRVIQDIKQKYAYTLAWRISAFELPGDNPHSHHPRTGNLLHECYKEMRKLKQKAIDCYVEYVGEKLTAEMRLIEGCLILDLHFRNYLHENREEHGGDGAFGIQDKVRNKRG